MNKEILKGVLGLMTSKKGVTAFLTALADLLTGFGLAWLDKPELIADMTMIITSLGGVLIGAYALQDVGKEKAKIEQETKKKDAEVFAKLVSSNKPSSLDVH